MKYTLAVILGIIVSIAFLGIFSSGIQESLGADLRVFTVRQGGTGTSTTPSDGQVLTGQADGTYAPENFTAPGDGVSNWLFNGSLTPSTTVGIGVFASSTIGNGTATGGLTISGGATSTKSLSILSTAAGGDNTTDSTSRLLLTSYQKAQNPNHFGEVIRIDLASSTAKGMIAWRDAFTSSPKSVAWIGSHYLPNDVGDPIHEHLSFETKASTTDEIYTRLGIDYNKDVADIDFNLSNVTFFNDGANDNGQVFFQNDLFDSNSFQLFPWGNRSDVAGVHNRTYGLSIDLTASTTATSTILNALGSTKLFFSDDIISLSNKIGIGTSSPQVALEVNQSDANTTVTTGNTPAIRIVNTNTTNNNMGELSFTTNDTNGTGLRTATILGINTSHTPNAMTGNLAFLTRNAGSFAERMRLTGTGLGIGTTTPSRLLTVAGEIYAPFITATNTLTIPYAADPTVDATGEIALNTTAASSSLRYYDGTAERQLKPEWSWGATFASSSLAYDGAFGQTGTTTVKRSGFKYGVTHSEYYCRTNSGNVTIVVGDGSASSSPIRCSSTGTTDSTASNGAFTPREMILIAVGSADGTTTSDIYFDATARWTTD